MQIGDVYFSGMRCSSYYLEHKSSLRNIKYASLWRKLKEQLMNNYGAIYDYDARQYHELMLPINS